MNCERCGGPTKGQNILGSNHRHFPDCISFLKNTMPRTRAQIETEIRALQPIAKDYDTERQSNDTCLAAGAHDALRWALGLAEGSISEGLKNS